MNVVVISGRLVRKPELRTTESLKHVCQFSLAVSRGYKDEVDFIDCVCFDKTAENLVKYQDKGNMIEVKGNIHVDTYTDKNNKNRSKTLIYVEMINYISSNKNGENQRKNDENDAYKEMSNRINSENDLPF